MHQHAAAGALANVDHGVVHAAAHIGVVQFPLGQ
jgi:hypothetical protein